MASGPSARAFPPSAPNIGTGQADNFVTPPAESGFQREMDSQFPRLPEGPSRLTTGFTQQSQSQSQTVQNDNLRHDTPSEPSDDDLVGQGPLATPPQTILRRSRQKKADRRCTITEEFNRVDGEEEPAPSIHLRDDITSPPLNLIVLNAQEFQASINERPREWFEALGRFLDEHRALVQLQETAEDSLNTLNVDLEEERALNGKQQRALKEATAAEQKAMDKATKYKEARDIYKNQKLDLEEVNRVLNQDRLSLVDSKAVLHKQNETLEKENRSLKDRLGIRSESETSDSDGDINRHGNKRSNHRRNNSRNMEHYRDDRRRPAFNASYQEGGPRARHNDRDYLDDYSRRRDPEAEPRMRKVSPFSRDRRQQFQRQFQEDPAPNRYNGDRGRGDDRDHRRDDREHRRDRSREDISRRPRGHGHQDEEPLPKESRPKWTEPPKFSGNRAEWRKWRIHLQTYIRVCAWQFPTAQHEIDYTRDHLGGEAYDTIENRADPESGDPYYSLEDMLRDLELLYGEKNKVAKAEAKLKDNNFRMAVVNRSETFEQFVARFNAAVAPLRLDDEAKIRHLRWGMTKGLQRGTAHLSGIKTDYHAFVEGVRDTNDYVDDMSLDNVHRLRDPQTASRPKPDTARNANGYSTRAYRKDTVPERTTKIGGHSITRFPAYIRAKILGEGRCFKCLEKGHRPTENNAPCKHSPVVAKEEAIIKLAAIGIVWDGVDGEDYDSEEANNHPGAETGYYSEN